MFRKIPRIAFFSVGFFRLKASYLLWGILLPEHYVSRRGKIVKETDGPASTPTVERNIVLNGRFLRPEEFAEYLGIPLRWIYRHIKHIPHHRVGKYLRFDLDSPALRHWIGSLEERPPE